MRFRLLFLGVLPGLAGLAIPALKLFGKLTSDILVDVDLHTSPT
jgi:hypothetical protein